MNSHKIMQIEKQDHVEKCIEHKIQYFGNGKIHKFQKDNNLKRENKK